MTFSSPAIGSRSKRTARGESRRVAAVLGLMLLGVSIGASSAVLPPSAILVVAGLAFGYLGGVPAAVIAIAVPARVQVPLLHSVSWADAAIIGAFACELDRGLLRIRGRWGPLSAFALLAGCSLAFSIDRTLTVRALIVLAEGLALGAATCNYVARRSTNADTFLQLWLIVGLFSAVSALVFFYLADPLVWWNLQKPTTAADLLSEQVRLGSPFWGASNYYASMLLLFVPAAWLAILVGRHRALAVVSLVVMTPALFLTTSRGAILALALGALYLLVRIVRSLPQLASASASDRRILGALLGAGAAVSLVLTGPQLVDYFFVSRGIDIGSLASTGRLAAYQSALPVVPSHLLVGVGYGAAPSAAPALVGGTHSYGLTLLLELGIPGLLIGIWAAIEGLRILGRRAHAVLLRSDARAILVRAGFAALVLTLINIQVEASFEGVGF
jgi:O-Antigen ligase